jgi:hypothetical protein
MICKKKKKRKAKGKVSNILLLQFKSIKNEKAFIKTTMRIMDKVWYATYTETVD